MIKQFFEAETIEVMALPAQSPDFNPIENILKNFIDNKGNW